MSTIKKILHKQLPLACALFLLSTIVYGQKQELIRPGELWPDTDGNHIQAHGGGIIKMGKTYYWYGEERRQGLDMKYRYVSCYSSRDLMNWKSRGEVIALAKPDSILEDRGWVLERPKVYHNKKTKKYVLYMHIDGRIKGTSAGYGYARVGVATSNKPTGPFKLVRTFRPLGKESRDIGQFIDDDGSAYLVFESRPSKGFYIVSLSEDYLDVEKEVSFIQSPLEGGAVVHYKGLYYVIGSALTGWRPNPNKVASAPSLAGPWSNFVDIAPPETNTYSSQSTMLLKVSGTKDTTVIFMADRWKPATQWDSRYIWMPVNIGEGKLWVPEPKPWKINVRTGEYLLSKPTDSQAKS
ncbi:MAG: family 43 glycosylhydrolase [Candidatus Dadabacteria bacterium]